MRTVSHGLLIKSHAALSNGRENHAIGNYDKEIHATESYCKENYAIGSYVKERHTIESYVNESFAIGSSVLKIAISQEIVQKKVMPLGVW